MMNKISLSETWEDIVTDEYGTKYLDIDDPQSGARFVILRGPMSICAYVGIPISTWNELTEIEKSKLPDRLRVHGGITFKHEGNLLDELRVDVEGNYCWFGWDYNHYQDHSIFPAEFPIDLSWQEGYTKWTPKLVYEDSFEAVTEFIQEVQKTRKE